MHLASKKKYFFILDKFKEIFKRREIIYSDIKEFLSSIFWIGAVILIVIYFGGIIGFYYVITGKCATYTYFWSKFTNCKCIEKVKILHKNFNYSRNVQMNETLKKILG